MLGLAMVIGEVLYTSLAVAFLGWGMINLLDGIADSLTQYTKLGLKLIGTSCGMFFILFVITLLTK